MGRVRGKVCEFFRLAALEAGLPPDHFFRAVPFGPSTAPDMVTWSDFAAMARSLRDVYRTDEQLVDIGARIVRLESMHGFQSVVRLGVSPRTLYWASHHWSGPAIMPDLVTTFTDLEDGRLRLTLAIPEDDEPSREFLLLVGGMFRSMPGIIGLPDAIVDVHVDPRLGVFVVTPPPAVGLGYRVRRSLSLLVGLGRHDDPTIATFNQLAEQQTELRRLWRQAVDALEVRQRFLASVSHELRTPLHGILGLNELLLDTPLDARQRELVDSVRGCADGLLGIIQQLLDFSRLEAKGVGVESIEADVSSLVDDAVELVAERARGQGLELVALVGPEVPARVVVDAGRLRQILVNLLDNAVKFTSAGEVVVRVGAAPLGPDQVSLQFQVEDTGMGVAPDRAAAIFEPFTQGDVSTSRRFGGTGLGLAICKQLTDLLGGEMGYERREGGGSRFWFNVPARTVTTEAAADPALAGRLAVLIEPHPDVRESLTLRLQRLGLEVVAMEALTTGRAAALAVPAPDLVLVGDKAFAQGGDELATLLGGDDTAAPALVLLTRSRTSLAQVPPDVHVLLRPVRLGALSHRLKAALAGERAEAISVPASAPTLRAAQARVLVAEDNPINQRVAVGMLERLGCAVDVVCDGGAAVEAVARGGYHLVLMDCQMPELDGYDATRAIRNLTGAVAKVPIVAMTAHAQAEDRDHCLAAGMDDYLAKPVRSTELEAVLTRYLPPGAHPQRPARLLELEAEVGPEVVRQLVTMFLDEARRIRGELDAALAAGGPDEVRRLAHRLKGGSRDLGLGAVADACTELERGAEREGDVAELRGLVSRLDAALTEAMPLLSLELPSH